MKILIIDRDVEYILCLRAALEAQGHDVTTLPVSEDVAAGLKRSNERLSSFRPQVTLCGIPWSKSIPTAGWAFAEAHQKLPKEFRSRLIMMADVPEALGIRHHLPQARAFHVEFKTKGFLLGRPDWITDIKNSPET